jgi:hypothetical protein
MKKIFFGLIATVLLWSNTTISQTLKISNSLENNATFIPSKTITANDDLLLKESNYSKFFEIKSYAVKSTILSYSFDKVESNGAIYLLKTVYDENKNIKTISISSNDASKLSTSLQTGINQNLASRASGCTIYGFSLWGCIKAFLGL